MRKKGIISFNMLVLLLLYPFKSTSLIFFLQVMCVLFFVGCLLHVCVDVASILFLWG